MKINKKNDKVIVNHSLNKKNNEILKNMLNEEQTEKLEYKKIPLNHRKAIDNILKDDPYYFKSISSRVGLNSNLINLSTYKYNYTPHKLESNKYKKKIIKVESFRNSNNFRQNIQSLNKIHYNKKNLINESLWKLPKDKLNKRIKAPTANLTTYNDSYLQYGNIDPTKKIAPLKFENKIKLPFLGNSTNRNYGNFSEEQFNVILKNQKKRNLKKQIYKNLFGPNLNINSESLSHHDFKKNIEVDKLKFDKKKDNLETNLPFLRDHFKTTNMDYNSKEINIILNNPKEIENNKKIKKTKIY